MLEIAIPQRDVALVRPALVRVDELPGFPRAPKSGKKPSQVKCGVDPVLRVVGEGEQVKSSAQSRIGLRHVAGSPSIASSSDKVSARSAGS